MAFRRVRSHRSNGDGEDETAVVPYAANRIVVAGTESLHHRRVETCIGHTPIVADRDGSVVERM